jgi:uncharacterized membrane protein YcaP (DUF421 family)
MESVVRAVVIYAMLLVLFRLTGKRSLGQITTFDFILLLIISEAVQNGMVGEGHSLTNALILVVTLVIIDLACSFLALRSRTFQKLVEGVPLVIVEHGRPLQDRMRKSRIEESEILAAARLLHGLERMEQIKYAVLERNGQISIIPDDRREAQSR